MKIGIIIVATLLTAVAASCIGDDAPKGTIPLGNYYFKSADNVWVLGHRQRLFDVFGTPTYRKLRSVDARRFHLLDADYATDDHYVWCAAPEPIAQARDVKPLGSGFFAVRSTVQKGCSQVFVSDDSKITPLLLASVQAVGWDREGRFASLLMAECTSFQ